MLAAYGFIRRTGSLVREIVEGPPKNPLESVAQQMPSATLTKYVPSDQVKFTSKTSQTNEPTNLMGLFDW
ncbi:hypothetical protein RHMOL_Rhmol03G0080700 [Rhododendron molle]|uniref:Uncharacterized protein n=1 Tax=Rhododendron molle TaxID=49168 RepID=A0ACC0PD06_RHOML|nr:hypothetical protein RHMOL_Rhmol03G0080700 [Rhododendron molle]